jgi:hypothetical protein
MLAAYHGDLDAVTCLLERGAHADARANNGKTALDLAAMDGAWDPSVPASHLHDKLRESLARWNVSRAEVIALLGGWPGKAAAAKNKR